MRRGIESHPELGQVSVMCQKTDWDSTAWLDSHCNEAASAIVSKVNSDNKDTGNRGKWYFNKSSFETKDKRYLLLD